MKLTKRNIDSANYEGDGTSRYVLWDEQIKGFGLRIYPSGKKVFILSYWAGGRKRQMTIGPYGVLTVDQARKEALKLLEEKHKGEDPLEKRLKKVRGPTMGILCEDYMERHSKPHKKSWKDDQRLIQRYILPAWANRKVSQTLRSDVSSLHHRIGKKSHYEANRTLSLLSKMFECAKEWGFLGENAGNPARGIKKFSEEKRSRYLKADELPRLNESLEKEPNIYIRSLFWLYLLTGLRKSELLMAKWNNLDLEKGVLRIPKTKSGKAYNSPLSPQAVAIFKKLPRMEGNPYVFASPIKEGQPLSSVHKNWQKIRKRAGLNDVRIHDLRRTVGSWIAQSEHNVQLVSKILNHADISTTAKVYAHLAESQVRGALGKHSKAVMQASKGKNAKVIRISRGI